MHSRVSASFEVIIEDKLTATLLNVSRSGVALLVSHKIELGLFTMTVHVPPGKLSLYVRVLRVEQSACNGGQFICGAVFVCTTEESLKVVADLLSHADLAGGTIDPRNRANMLFPNLQRVVLDKSKVAKNIENMIGTAQIPVGLAGPIKVNGDSARGFYHVPFATTEGTLVGGYTLGMLCLSRAGGVRTKVLSRKVDITPIFEFTNLDDAFDFSCWIKNHYIDIKAYCERTTAHGKLLELRPVLMGKRIYVYFVYDSSDAMGLNMISIATHSACEEIRRVYQRPFKYYLRSNLSSDKKPAYSNFLYGYGKEVIAEATIKASLVRKYLGTSAREMHNFWYASALSGFQAGTMGHNAHYANGLAAIYIACGQDPAQVVNSCVGVSGCEVSDEENLYVFVRLPCLILGTVGGGTHLDTQRECLEIMGCYGENKSDKFAEIIGATLLAGELSICAALSSGEFINAHIRKRLAKE